MTAARPRATEVVAPQEFRYAMSQFLTGVTVVTTAEDGRPHGCTVSSFCSLSQDPPLVLVCIGRDRAMHDHLVHAPGFAVNVLRADHAEVARRFANPTPDRFAGLEVRAGRHGVPVLSQAVAAVECDLHDVLDGGDHAIVLGLVRATTVAGGEPLAYLRGGLF